MGWILFFAAFLRRTHVKYVDSVRGQEHSDFRFADVEFIRKITLGDMHGFLAYCQNIRNSSPTTRSRKIVSIRQFWKYLKTKAHLIDNNIAEELETPKAPKRIVRSLTLEESVRLLIEARASSVRDNCIITFFLNCALRLSELASLNVDQVNTDVLSVIGKGNKERKIYMTPAVKQALTLWLPIRSSMTVNTDALFISRNSGRLTTRAIQNVVKKHIIASGINPEGLSTHKLRHTAATLMYKYDRVDIRSLQQLLGHESIATTEIYTHVDDGQLLIGYFARLYIVQHANSPYVVDNQHSLFWMCIAIVIMIIGYFLDYTILGKHPLIIGAGFVMMVILIRCTSSADVSGMPYYVFYYGAYLVVLIPVVYAGILWWWPYQGYSGLITAYLALIIMTMTILAFSVI